MKFACLMYNSVVFSMVHRVVQPSPWSNKIETFRHPK